MKRALFERLSLLAASFLAAATVMPSLSSAEISSSPRFSPEQASRILTLRNVGLAPLEEDRPKEARATFAKLADRADLHAIRAVLENERNRPAAVRAALEKAAALDPRDLESRWRFARSVETDPSSSPAEKAARRTRLAEIVARSPSNLPARLKLLVLQGEAGDAPALSKGVAELDPLVSDGDARARQFLGEARTLLGLSLIHISE